VSIIKCADCREYEVKKQSKHVRCLCTSCYSKREARNRHYLFALDNNGINGSIERECRGKCGTVINTAHGVKSVWCTPCKEKAERKQRRMKSASERRRRRGGRVQGVAYDPYAVFKRDKWRCYICNTKTQKKDIYSDNAAEIDHVIPLSKGGKDIPSNVKCCCRACNRDKSDKIIPVVGNLFCQV
jgi:5-methylcytosine-specific restriction endonuclease McrA